MSAIDTQLTLLEAKPSQWNVKLTCDRKSTATHISIPKAMDDIGNVYVDKQSGKLYNDGLGYVKANGADNISRVNHNIPSAESGIIEVTLTWDDVAIKYELEIFSWSQRYL